MGQLNDFENSDTSTNIRVAIERLNNQDHEGALNIVNSLLANEEVQKNDPVHAQALFISGICKLFLKHSIEEVISPLRKSAQISQEIGRLDLLCQSTYYLGQIEVARGEYLTALQDYVACIQNLEVNKYPSAFILEIADATHKLLALCELEESHYALWIEAVSQLGYLYLSLKPQEAINVALNALKYPLEKKELGTVNELAGLAYGMIGENKKSIEHFEFASNVTTGLKNASILGNLGRAYRRVGDIAKALETFEKLDSTQLDSINKESGLGLLHAQNLLELGAIHNEMGNPQRARVCFDQVIEITTPFFESDIQYRHRRVDALTNLGLLDTYIQHFDSALENQLAALKLLKEGERIHLETLAMVETNLSFVYGKLGKFKEAAEHMRAVLEAHEGIGNLPAQIEVLQQLARIEMQIDNPSMALTLLERELALLEKLEGQGLRYAHNLLNIAQVSTKSGDENKAIWAFDGAVKLFESLGHIQLLATTLSAYSKFFESHGYHDRALELKHRLESIVANAKQQEKSDVEALHNALELLQAGKTVPQDDIKDSIERLSKNQNHFILALHTRSQLLRKEGKYDDAIATIEKALSYLPQVGRDERKAYLLLNKGQLLLDTGLTPQQVIDTMNEAIENIPLVSNNEMRGELWYRAGRFCIYLDDRPRAINYFQHAAEDFARVEAFKKQADAQYQLGVTYSEMKIRRAIWCFIDAEKNYQKSGDLGNLLTCKLRFALALTNLGLVDFSINKLIDLVNLASQQGMVQTVFTGFSLLYAIAIRQKNMKLIEGLWQDLSKYILANRSYFVNHPLLNIIEQFQSNSDDLETIANQFTALGIQSIPDELLNAKEDQSEDNDKKLWEYMEMLVNEGLRRQGFSFEQTTDPIKILEADSRSMNDNTIKQWDIGLSKQKGWTGSSLRLSVLKSLSIGLSKENSLADLQKVKELIATYSELSVWVDPNLGLIRPIIDTYTYGTRFWGKTAINPSALKEGSLHFFFFRSDPLGMLATFAKSCTYVNSGNIIFCSLPFLEELVDYVEIRGDWNQTHDIKIFFAKKDQIEKTDDLKNIQLNELRDNSEMPIDEIREMVTKMSNADEKEFLLSWVIAHEIGHAVLEHSSSFIGLMLSAQEEAADEFFIDHIHGTVDEWRALCNILLKAYYRHHELEYGYPYQGESYVTISVPIHIQLSSGNHAHFLIRLLDLGDRLIKRFPTMDQTGPQYLAAVRRNLIIEEQYNEHAN